MGKNVRIRILSILTGATLAFGGTAVSTAQQPEQPPRAEPPGQGQSQVSPLARETLETMHQKNQLEIETAAMAQKKAQNPQVREFARTIEKEHRQNDQKVTRMAGELGVELKAQPDPAEKRTAQAVKQALQAAEGEAFDQLYIQTQIAGHKRAINKLEQAQVDNEQVKQLMSGTLPKLREHLEKAEKLQKEMTAG